MQRGNTAFTDAYYPVAIAADIAGYDVSAVYRLIRQGKVSTKGDKGHMKVHLGSLVSRRKWGSKSHQVQRWLRNCLSRKLLAEIASRELGYPVNEMMISRAMRKVNL
jgi:hypothetical protein